MMHIGAFKLIEPLPQLRNPHAFAILRPWIDVGSVGNLTLQILEEHFHAQVLAELKKPGTFFDFTRYRPTVRYEQCQRVVTIPNSYISYARRDEGNDLVFLNILEPHMFGEVYARSLLKMLDVLGVERYYLLGGMHDAVPHTRPLLVSGTAGADMGVNLQTFGVQPSEYEGPTTITLLVSQEAMKHDIEVITLIVHLPQYTQLEEDYSGLARLLEIVCPVQNFSIDLQWIKDRGRDQYKQVSEAVSNEPKFEQVVRQLEHLYESQSCGFNNEASSLSPDIENFLKEIDSNFS